MLLSWPEKSSSGLKACIGDDVYDTGFILLLGVSSLALIASLRISDIVAFDHLQFVSTFVHIVQVNQASFGVGIIGMILLCALVEHYDEQVHEYYFFELFSVYSN